MLALISSRRQRRVDLHLPHIGRPGAVFICHDSSLMVDHDEAIRSEKDEISVTSKDAVVASEVLLGERLEIHVLIEVGD